MSIHTRKHEKRNGRFPVAAALCAAALAAAAVVGFAFWSKPGRPDTDLGTEQQFVWNDRIIDPDKTTAALTLHTPVRQQVVLTTDRPWEGTIADGFTVVACDSGYRLYYSTYDTKEDAKVCVAQSTDGIRWEKPALGLVSFEGDTANNILFDQTADITNGFYPFRDENPKAEADALYKAVAVNSEGLPVGYISADGLVWQETGPLSRQPIAGANAPVQLCSVFWDAARQRYCFCYTAEQNGQQSLLMLSSKTLSAGPRQRR